MPGGGTLVNASLVGGNAHVNNGGDVVFSAIVDTDVDGEPARLRNSRAVSRCPLSAGTKRDAGQSMMACGG